MRIRNTGQELQLTTYLFNLDGLANSGLIKLLLQHLVLESVLLLAKQK